MNQRSRPAIDLGFFSWCGLDNPHRLGRTGSPKLADKALDRLVAVREPVIRDQVLPDGHGIAATVQTELDQFPLGLTGAWDRPQKAEAQDHDAEAVGVAEASRRPAVAGEGADGPAAAPKHPVRA